MTYRQKLQLRKCPSEFSINPFLKVDIAALEKVFQKVCGFGLTIV